MKPPIDTDDRRAACGRPVHERKMPAAQMMAAEAVAVLELWAAPGR